MSMAWCRSPYIRGIATGSPSLMTSLASRLSTSWSENLRPSLHSNSSRLGLRMWLERSWALWGMTRVENTCQGSLRHYALTMASRGSTLSVTTRQVILLDLSLFIGSVKCEFTMVVRSYLHQEMWVFTYTSQQHLVQVIGSCCMTATCCKGL